MIGRNEEAIERFTTLIKSGSNISGLYKNRAYARAAIDDYQNALNDINLAIKNSPGESDLHYSRGVYLFKLGDIKGGCAAFKAASSLGMQEIGKWLKSNEGKICAADG